MTQDGTSIVSSHRRTRTRITVAMTTMAATFWLADAHAQDFCAALRQAIQNAPQNFAALRVSGGPKVSSPYSKYYNARLRLPGARECEIMEHVKGLATYTCQMVRANSTPAEARATARRDLARVRTCLSGFTESRRGRWTVNPGLTVRVATNTKIDDDDFDPRDPTDRSIYSRVIVEKSGR